MQDIDHYVDKNIKNESSKILARNAYVESIVSILGSIGLIFLLNKDALPQDWRPWLAYMILISLLCIFISRFEVIKLVKNRDYDFPIILYITTILQATGWGATSYFLFDNYFIVDQAYLTVTIIGILSAAIASFSISRLFLNTFILISAVPLIIRFFSLPQTDHYLFGSFLITMLIVMGFIGRRLESALFSSLRLRYRNKKLVMQLQNSIKDAEDANRLKGEFLANMSHEIRTPMNAIIGFSTMAMQTNLNDEQEEYLKAVKNAGDSLLTLINDILDFSKIEASKLDVETIPFDLNELLSNIIEINSGKAKEKGLKLIKDAQIFPRMIISDPTRLQQIITNLIGNAIKFTTEGSVSIIVKRAHEDEDRIQIRFSVQDTGIGIPQDRQKAIFEAFTQADGGITRSYGGTGLGLSISNQLVNLLGGTSLQVSSEPGKGSNFFFDLAFLCGEKITEKKKVKENSDSFSSKSYDILLVEDNPVNIKLATKMLSKNGHNVTVAENGKLGFEAAFKGDFDFILMDMMMPELDGLGATRLIREKEKKEWNNKRHIPVIAMTANAMKGDMERCLEAGMDGYVSKPINLPALAKEIHRVMEKLNS